MKCNIRKRFK